MRKILFLIGLLQLLSLEAFAQYGSQPYNEGFTRTFGIDPISVEVEIIPEDIDSGWYALVWTSRLDSVFDIPGQPLEEFHVFVRDSKGVIGQYTGQSTPMHFFYFRTDEKEVSVFFMKRKNLFAAYRADADENDTTQVWMIQMMEDACDQSEYSKVVLKVEDEYPRKLTLQENTNVITLTHINKGAMVPDEMPCVGCCGYDKVLVLVRFYLDPSSGKILRGRQWFNRKSIRKLVNEIDLLVINPTNSYEDQSGEEWSGQSLIDAGKIDMPTFDPFVFAHVNSLLPY